ncbi:putative protein forming the bulk of type IV secretion complex that spans outer membrane and periplasm (VirB9) (plasmid) [Collimonas arenae]|uniref:Type IV secretion system protein VirB9 n=1 Tax=Collimonas arenae TaxID=279058 RepID=A0A0A1FML3_9BURK|nr:P-type conjugative transfer protein VirB9 [Collimonas arenae]AIY44192.1 putative protein forming the bulk of type IV secretion complex that spans outer membrane and periplasm (VirB9) [Collimonas arenae]
MKKNTLSIAAATIAGASMFSALPAHAAKTPNSLVSDQRIKQVAYDANQVYEIVGTYGYQTTIELAPDEVIKVRTIGDSIAWQTVISGSRVFVKPVEPNAATNMTLVTNKRTYFFKLNSSSKQGDITFLVRFIYPNANSVDVVSNAVQSQSNDRTTKGFDPAKTNSHYFAAGDKTTIPLKSVFDDGEFTWFLFEKNSEKPGIYIVGSDGKESVVNTRRDGEYLVVERLGHMFTLRNGDAHLCVENIAINAKKLASSASDLKGGGH